MKSPIALFVYKRLEHTKKTIEALQRNTLAKESDLFIFSDGPRHEQDAGPVNEVRKYLKTITGFKSITLIERPENLGLATSIITGVTEIIRKYKKIIVIEDDLVTSPFFLKYMNEALDLYENEEKVASIHGYIYPLKKDLTEVFFLRGADCWGWATWERAWNLFIPDGEKLLKELSNQKLLKTFDLENSYHYSQMLERQIAGKNDSWAIRWHASIFLQNMLTLYPYKSLVQNIGHDSSGTHSTHSTSYDVTLATEPIYLKKIPIEESAYVRKLLIKHFRSAKKTILRKLLSKIRI